jgi:opacity protein-like surface antigen
MKVFALGAAAAASLLSPSAFAACEQPSMVAVPDGATATMEELLAAQGSVKSYMAEMEIYLACLNEELETAGEDAPAEFKSLMVNRHNAAVTEMETVAAAFNQEVQAHRNAHPEPAAQ